MAPLMAGSSLAILSHLAAELGYRRQWEAAMRSRFAMRRRRGAAALALVSPRQAGTSSEDSRRRLPADLRLEAERAAARSGEPTEIESIFDQLPQMSLLERALLADDLRPQASRLSEDVIPRALASSDTRRVLAVLQMIGAWKRMLPAPAIYSLLRSGDAGVRAAALRTLTYDIGSHEPRRMAAIPDLLRDTEPEVRRAAAEAAGALRLSQVIEPLRQALTDADAGVVRASCYALAALGPDGRRSLEKEILAGTRAARVATEALERGRIRPGEDGA
jgi:hypothetical protein